ncbi:MAG: TonB-dependent receptor [Longimicrobiales bacterium]|nr:TonB-dependent receptor [Longimicrobiales bacterium]
MSHTRCARRSPFILLVVPLILVVPLPLGAQGVGGDPGDTISLPGVEVKVLTTPTTGAGPYAATVREGASLRTLGAAAFLEDAVRGIPGVQIQNRGNYALGERWIIRGFGARSQFGVRGIRFLVDGIPASLPDGQATLDHVDAAALERIEILRGPSAARFGNAAGGVVAIETRRPAGGRSAEARGGGGSDGLASGSFAIEDGSGSVPFRISVRRLESNGFRTDRSTGEPFGGVERWTFTGRADTRIAGGELTISGSALDLDARNPGSLPLEEIDADDRPARDFNVLSGARKAIEQGQLGVRWRPTCAATPCGGLEASAWVLTRSVDNPIPGAVIDLDRTAFGARVEQRGGGEDVRWALGIEAQAQDDDRRNFENEGGARGALTLDQTEEVSVLSAFGQLVVGPGVPGLAAEGSGWEAHTALRADRTHFDATDRFLVDGDPDDSGDRTMTSVSPSIGVIVAPVSGIELFASTGSFFETPTTTELVNRPSGAGGLNPELDPRRGWTAEAGARAARMEGSWVMEGEVVGFGAWIRDELVSFEVPSDPGRSFFRNAGKSRHRGVEAGLRLRHLGERALFRFAVTRIDARFRESDDDPREIAGNRIPGVAPTRFDATAEASAGPLRLALDLLHTGSIPVDDEGGPEAPSATTLDLRATAQLDTPLGGVAPWATVRNLTDREWVASVVPNAFGGRFFEPGPGRTFEVGLRFAVQRDPSGQ